MSYKLKVTNSFILIPGFGEKTEKKLWKNNITSWNQLKETSIISSKKKKKATKFIQKAEKNLQVGNSLFFADKLPTNEQWRMYKNFQENTCFFDIETTGLDKRKNKVTTVSFHKNGESKTLVRNQDLNRKNLQQQIQESSLLVSFNGKRFDQPFLEKNFNLDIETPHIDLMYVYKRLGITGGLKQIEKQLNIERDLEDIDGKEAIRLWKLYEHKNKENALEKLIKYKQYDARNLQKLLEIAHKRLTNEIYTPHIK